LGDHDLGPDSPIKTGFFEQYQHHLVSRWEDLSPSKMYIMMEVNHAGEVINGGSANADDDGHIVITQPGPFVDLPGDPYVFGVWVVEATGGHSPEGLWESSYRCKSYNKTTKVFSVLRDGMDAGHRKMDVKIVEVG
jgi:hypothetical protein